jgi:hypothetical protein
MGILARVGGALQGLFGGVAQQAAAESGVIQRTRKFEPTTLLETFVLGHLQNPQASDEKLAQMAAQCGVDVTPQAIEQRYTPAMVAYLRKAFEGATQVIVGSSKILAAILERFSSVSLLDSTTTVLPDELQEEFPGCGGSHGGGAAAMKLQTEWDLRTGALTHVEVEPGRNADGASRRQHARRGPGSLRISDLGYFSIAVFAAMVAAAEHFLSRLQFGTTVLLLDGAELGTATKPMALLSWLAQQPGPFIDRQIVLGHKERLRCRLIAWRLPAEQANRRRQKLRQETLSKKGRVPSAARLAWCDWTLLVTSVPVDRLTAKEAAVLYRARWQVEVLFKCWKSQGLVAQLNGSTVVRQMVRVWSRLLAVLVQHWLVIGSIGGNATKSLSKAYEAVRAFAGRIAAAVTNTMELQRVLADIERVLAKTCRRDKRRKPGTYELLNDVELLDFDLT